MREVVLPLDVMGLGEHMYSLPLNIVAARQSATGRDRGEVENRVR
ncbi:hypothetical protein Agau_C102239 [Agrobacterium tumefaciens F2]|jgi:hypothetical protein|nr:hypothetical protein Agau_C102239 [Agrobacterium tumefaciens F2]